MQDSNRFSSYVNVMKEACPNDVQAYARCISEQDSCEIEFNHIKACVVHNGSNGKGNKNFQAE
jgi:hypothetical protein